MIPVEIAEHYKKDLKKYPELVGTFQNPGKLTILLRNEYGVTCPENEAQDLSLNDNGSFLIANIFHYVKKHGDLLDLNGFYQFCLSYKNDILGAEYLSPDRAGTIIKTLLTDGDFSNFGPLVQFDKDVFDASEFESEIFHLTIDVVGTLHEENVTTYSQAKNALKSLEQEEYNSQLTKYQLALEELKKDPRKSNELKALENKLPEKQNLLEGMSDETIFKKYSITVKDIEDYIKALPTLSEKYITDAVGYVASNTEDTTPLKYVGPNQQNPLILFPFKSFILLKRVTHFFANFEKKLKTFQLGQVVNQNKLEDKDSQDLVLDFVLKTKDNNKELLYENLSILHTKFATDSQKLYALYDRIFAEIGSDFLVSIFKGCKVSLEVIQGYLKRSENVKNFVIEKANSVTNIDADLIKWSLCDEEEKINFIKKENFFLYLLNKNFQKECLPVLENLHTEICDQFFNGNENSKDAFFLFLKLSPLEKNRAYLHNNMKAYAYVQDKILNLMGNEKLGDSLVYKESDYFEMIEWLLFDEETSLSLAASSFFYNLVANIRPSENIIEKLIQIFDKDINRFFENRSKRMASLDIEKEANFINLCSYVHIEYYKQMILTSVEKGRVDLLQFYIPKFFEQEPQACAEFILIKLNEKALQEALSHLDTKANKEHIIAWLEALPAQYLEGVLNGFEEIQPLTSEIADQIVSAFYDKKPDFILQWCIKRDFFANYASHLYKKSPKTLASFMGDNKALTDEQVLTALKLFSKDDLQDAIVAWRELVDNDEESRAFLSAHKIEVNEDFLNLLETVQNTETLLADADIDELKPKALELVSQELIEKINEEANSNPSEKSNSKQIVIELIVSFNLLAGTFPISLLIRPLSKIEIDEIVRAPIGNQLTTLSDLISGQLSSFKAWFLRFSSRYREFSSVLEPTETLNTKGITEVDRARVRLLSSANWISLGANALPLLDALPLPKEELWQRILENWSEEDFTKLGCSSFTWKDLKDAFEPQADKNLAERVNNMNQARRKIGLELKIPNCFVAPGANLHSQTKPELLYQLQENDIQVGEEILRCVQKRDKSFEYLLMPFPNVVGNLADPGDRFGLSLKNIMESIPNRNPDEKPILVHGTLSVNDNHYLPFFAYKNSFGKIQVITIDPSAPHRNEKSKTVIDLENYFRKFNFEYHDAQIAQQLSERNCGFLSMDTQLVAITKPLFKLENDSLALDPSQLTVNGNINRILDKDNHTYLYTTTLESAANQLRFQWAKKFEEFNFNEAEEPKVQAYLLLDENSATIEDLRHIQNKTIAPEQEVITILPLEKYNYKENYGTQRQHDTDAELKSEIFCLIEEVQAGFQLMNEIKKGFTDTLTYPDDEALLPLLSEVQKAFDEQKRHCGLPSSTLNLTQLKPVIANILQAITLETLHTQFRHFLYQFDDEDNSYPSCEKVVEKFLKGSNSDQLLSLLHSLTESERNVYLRHCTRTAEKPLLDRYLQKTLLDVTEFIKTNWLEIQKNLNPDETLEQIILNRLDSQHAGVHFLNTQRNTLMKFEVEPISVYILRQIKNLKEEHYSTQYTALKTALGNCSLPDLISRFKTGGTVRIHDLLKDQADVMLQDAASCQAISDMFYQTLSEQITEFLSDNLLNETLPNLMALYNHSTKLQERLNSLLKDNQIHMPYELWSYMDYNRIFSVNLISEHCKRHLNLLLEFLALSPKSNMTLEQMKRTVLSKREGLLTVAAKFGWEFIFDTKNKLTEQGGYLIGLLSAQFPVYKKEQMDQKNVWKKHKAIQEKLLAVVGTGVIDLTDFILDDAFDSKARCQEITDIIASNYEKLTTGLLRRLSGSSYEAYVILKSAVSNNLWEHLHTQTTGTTGTIGTSLSIESERFLELEPLIEAVCKTKEERERVIYNGVKLPNLTKGLVTDCLHLFRELGDKQKYTELGEILHELYNSTAGSLNVSVTNSSALKKLRTLLHKFLKDELEPEAESIRKILMKLAKTKIMANLLKFNLKDWNDDKVREIINSNYYDSKTNPISILEKDSDPRARRLKQLHRFNKSGSYRFMFGCDSLIEQIKTERDFLDAIDLIRLDHKIRDDIERIWDSEKDRMRENAQGTTARRILSRYENKLTYAALQELYIYWQVNHHAITTILHPGRWFKANHMPDGIRQIGLVLNDFNKRLINGAITSPWVEVSEDDKLLLKVITGLRDRRTHFFDQTRSAEIFGVISGHLTNNLPTTSSVDRLGRLENKANLELKHFRFKLQSQLGQAFFQPPVPSGVTQNNKRAVLPSVGRRG